MTTTPFFDIAPSSTTPFLDRYGRLHETIGIEDEGMVLDVLVQKIVTNLQFWSASDVIISKTLALLTALCMGYASLRRLVKSERVQYILTNHSPREFPFLELCEVPLTFTSSFVLCALGVVVVVVVWCGMCGCGCGCGYGFGVGCGCVKVTTPTVTHNHWP
jgi:hypothetical protein